MKNCRNEKMVPCMCMRSHLNSFWKVFYSLITIHFTFISPLVQLDQTTWEYIIYPDIDFGRKLSQIALLLYIGREGFIFFNLQLKNVSGFVLYIIYNMGYLINSIKFFYVHVENGRWKVNTGVTTAQTPSASLPFKALMVLQLHTQKYWK